MRNLLLGLVAAFTLTVGGCTSLASGVTDLAGSFTSSSPSQVTVYGDATLAADIATRTVDLAVKTGKLDRATLLELQTLNDAVHAAWVKLKAANDAGQSLSFASFNAALAAFQSYRTSTGIPEAPKVATP